MKIKCRVITYLVMRDTRLYGKFYHLGEELQLPWFIDVEELDESKDFLRLPDTNEEFEIEMSEG